MINSAILLLLLHYSLLNAQSRSRTHDIKKQTTFTKKKREKHSSHERKHQLTKSTKSLSLSPCRWSPSLFLCQKLFFIQKFRRECVETWQPKNKKFRSFPHIRAFSSCASPETDERTPACAYSREKEHYHKKHISIIVKIMFAMRMMRSNAAPTTTTHNQNKTHNFHPKRLTAFKGIRRQRRCRVPLVAMSIPQQGGNAQPRESYILFSLFFSFSCILSILSVRAIVSRRRFLDAAASTFSLSSLSTSGGRFG